MIMNCMNIQYICIKIKKENHMKIEYVSHACLKIELTNGKILMCDPWILNEPVFNFTTWKFPPVSDDYRSLVNHVDYLFITHSHEDHFHVPSLNLFDRDIKIILPEYDMHCSLRAHTIERTLRELGFGNISKVKSWCSYKFSEKISLTVIPSANTRDHDWENCGFILEDNGVSMLNMNDNVSDIELCNEINKRFKKQIDIGFIQAMGVTMWPGRYDMTHEQMKEEVKTKNVSFYEQKRMVDIVRPKAVVPFAGDFCWLDKEYLHQNWSNRTTPQVFSDFMTNTAENKNIRYYLMEPGETWSDVEGYIENSERVNWHNYLNEIDVLRHKKSHKIIEIRKWIEATSTENLIARSEYRLNSIKRNITRDYIDFSEVVKFEIQGANEFHFYMMVDQNQGFSWSYTPFEKEHFQTLKLKDVQYAAILEGKLSFNIIQWIAISVQHYKPKDYGRFWYWLEYHIDLNTKNVQVYLDDKILPKSINRIEINRGVF